MGVDPVRLLPVPSYSTATQRVEQAAEATQAPDGTWELGWVVAEMDLSPEDLAAQTQEKSISVRAERNEKLAASDWTQLGDSTADKGAWAAYRQALRDITAQSGFPWTIEWPVQP